MRHLTLTWSPVILRGTLWVGLAMLKCYIDAMHNTTRDQIAGWGWWGWSILIASILMEGGGALRLYLDQSLSDHKRKLNNENNVNVNGPGTLGSS